MCSLLLRNGKPIFQFVGPFKVLGSIGRGRKGDIQRNRGLLSCILIEKLGRFHTALELVDIGGNELAIEPQLLGLSGSLHSFQLDF